MINSSVELCHLQNEHHLIRREDMCIDRTNLNSHHGKRRSPESIWSPLLNIHCLPVILLPYYLGKQPFITKLCDILRIQNLPRYLLCLNFEVLLLHLLTLFIHSLESVVEQVTIFESMNTRCMQGTHTHIHTHIYTHTHNTSTHKTHKLGHLGNLENTPSSPGSISTTALNISCTM